MIKYFLRRLDWELKQQTEGAAGFELKADMGCQRVMGPSAFVHINDDEPWILKPGDRWLVPTGLHLAIPPGMSAVICSRSGLAVGHGVVVFNAPGIVDSDYRGEVKVCLANFGYQPYTLVPGERIAQIVFTPYFPQAIPLFNEHGVPFVGQMNEMKIERVGSIDQLGDTERGVGGFGSTGR